MFGFLMLLPIWMLKVVGIHAIMLYSMLLCYMIFGMLKANSDSNFPRIAFRATEGIPASELSGMARQWWSFWVVGLAISVICILVQATVLKDLWLEDSPSEGWVSTQYQAAIDNTTESMEKVEPLLRAEMEATKIDTYDLLFSCVGEKVVMAYELPVADSITRVVTTQKGQFTTDEKCTLPNGEPMLQLTTGGVELYPSMPALAAARQWSSSRVITRWLDAVTQSFIVPVRPEQSAVAPEVKK